LPHLKGQSNKRGKKITYFVKQKMESSFLFFCMDSQMKKSKNVGEFKRKFRMLTNTRTDGRP
jgi:hypothetical protein